MSELKIATDGIEIKVAEKECILEELKQKLINDMYKKENYELVDVEILKILFKKD